METNPMDGYRDIYPWPYHWHRDIAADPISRLAAINFIYDNLDIWTYHNHWSVEGTDVYRSPEDYCTDLYWSNDGEFRLQLPPDIGDHVAEYLIAHEGEHIRCLMWMYRIWIPASGWGEWRGPQGDFVDHIHIEWLTSDDHYLYDFPY